jgi:hypothetical protein
VTDASPSGWDSGYQDVGNGWRHLAWFGTYNVNYAPWIYHQQHRWLYPVGDTAADMWFYSLDGMGWLWTCSTVYPWLYSLNQGTWLYYLKGTAAPRWFFNWNQQQWQAVNP